MREVSMTSTDPLQQRANELLQQRAKECRRLAATARNAGDKVFWLGLYERWQAVGNRSARQYYLKARPARGPLAKA